MKANSPRGSMARNIECSRAKSALAAKTNLAVYVYYDWDKLHYRVAAYKPRAEGLSAGGVVAEFSFEEDPRTWDLDKIAARMLLLA